MESYNSENASDYLKVALAAADKAALLAFQQKTARLQRGVLGAVKAAGEAQNRLSHIKKAIADTPQADPGLIDQANSPEAQLHDHQVELSGDKVVSSRSERTPMSITSRVNRIVGGQWTSTAAPTQTNRDAYDSRVKSLRGCWRTCGSSSARTSSSWSRISKLPADRGPRDDCPTGNPSSRE